MIPLAQNSILIMPCKFATIIWIAFHKGWDFNTCGKENSPSEETDGKSTHNKYTCICILNY